MTDCRHAHLFLMPQDANRLRCRHCHLTLRAEDLDGGYCPECLAVSGERWDDFDRIESGTRKVQYRCEDCGTLLNPVGA